MQRVIPPGESGRSGRAQSLGATMLRPAGLRLGSIGVALVHLARPPPGQLPADPYSDGEDQRRHQRALRDRGSGERVQRREGHRESQQAERADRGKQAEDPVRSFGDAPSGPHAQQHGEQCEAQRGDGEYERGFGANETGGGRDGRVERHPDIRSGTEQPDVDGRAPEH